MTFFGVYSNMLAFIWSNKRQKRSNETLEKKKWKKMKKSEMTWANQGNLKRIPTFQQRIRWDFFNAWAFKLSFMLFCTPTTFGAVVERFSLTPEGIESVTHAVLMVTIDWWNQTILVLLLDQDSNKIDESRGTIEITLTETHTLDGVPKPFQILRSKDSRFGL